MLERSKAAELLPLVYTDLRSLARQRLAKEPPGRTLCPTELVHEVYLRLVGEGHTSWDSRGHFFAAAAEAMRRILVERARRRLAAKRGGGQTRVSLDEAVGADEFRSVDLLALDDALADLERQDPRASQVVMLRYFAGLEVEDTARALGVSPRTVKRDWNFARAWLYDQIARCR